MHDDVKQILLSESEISDTVSAIAEKINSDYNNEPLLAIVILKGSIFFAADLLRKLTMPLTIDFMKVSSYANETTSSGMIKLALDTEADLAGMNVLIIEDIIDSGNTLSKVKQLLSMRNAKSVKICTFLDKPDRREADIEADYVGRVIPNEFVVGYGMDFAENYRNLPYIGALKESVYN